MVGELFRVQRLIRQRQGRELFAGAGKVRQAISGVDGHRFGRLEDHTDSRRDEIIDAGQIRVRPIVVEVHLQTIVTDAEDPERLQRYRKTTCTQKRKLVGMTGFEPATP